MIKLFNYKKVMKLFISLALQNYHVYLKSHISVLFPRKSYCTRIYAFQFNQSTQVYQELESLLKTTFTS